MGPHCDPRLADTVESLIQRCISRLGAPDVLVHGDAQPDNAGWTATGPTLFDLDDACVSWAAADLAMAVRDAQPIDVLDTPATSSAPGRALLRGYREQATLAPEEERLIPLMQRLSAALTCARLREATSPDSVTDPEPDWLRALRDRLLTIADQLRAALLRPEAAP